MANEYHKIQTLWLRESEKPHNMLVGSFANDYFEYLKENNWIWFEKVDGTNIRIIWDGHMVVIKGKTDRAQIQDNMLDMFSEDIFTEERAQVFEQQFGNKPITLYGECFGAGVQNGGGYEPDGLRIAIFDVLIDGYWLNWDNVMNVCGKLDFETVKILGEGSLVDASTFAEESHKSFWGDREIEGIVMKPQVEMLDRRGNRIMSKLKKKDFDKIMTIR